MDKVGKLTLRHGSVLMHLGVGRAHKGKRVVKLINERDVRVIDAATYELLPASRSTPIAATSQQCR